MHRADDNQFFATAEEIQRRRPQWMIQWGIATRRYWAFPMFDTTVLVCLYSEDPVDLIMQMDEAERSYRVPLRRRNRTRLERTDSDRPDDPRPR